MLKRNVCSYGDKLTPKVIVQNEGFTGQNFEQYLGCALFFYPDWSDPNDSDTYLTHDIKIFNKTIEEWLTEYEDVACAFLFQAPPDYNMKPENCPKWNIKDETEYSKIKRGNETIQRPRAKIFYGKSTYYGGDSKKYQDNKFGLKPIETLDKNQLPFLSGWSGNKNISNLNWSEKCNLLPIRDPSIGSNEWFQQQNTEEWLESYQKYLYNLLSIFIPDEDNILQMLSIDNMKIWVEAVTNITYNVEDNYEKHEKDGDECLKHAFPRYIRYYYNATEKQITSWNNYYMSKRFQYVYTEEMKFNYWLLCEGEHITNMRAVKEDLFESFVGALETIADKIAHGLGYIYSYNFIFAIFENIVLDPKIGLGDIKTELQQRGTQLKFDRTPEGHDGGIKAEESKDQLSGEITITIIMFKEIAAILAAEGIIIESLKSRQDKYVVIGIGRNIYKSYAIEEAWDNAANYCESCGYTDSYMKSIKQTNLLKHNSLLTPKEKKDINTKLLLNQINHYEIIFPQSLNKEDVKVQTCVFQGSKVRGSKLTKLSIGTGKNRADAEHSALIKYLKT